jgi:hypothetical protein
MNMQDATAIRLIPFVAVFGKSTSGKTLSASQLLAAAIRWLLILALIHLSVGPSKANAQNVLFGAVSKAGRSGAGASRKRDIGPAFCPRPQDEVWLISSRDVCSPCDDPGRLQISRIVGNGRAETTLNDLVQTIESTSGFQNIFYIHGNNTDDCWAERSGKAVYQLNCGNRCHVPPVRFVIWSWPSEKSGARLKRPVRDFRRNLDRCPIDGEWFGYVLSRLPDDADPLIFTYSLGCQVGLTAVSSPAILETGRQYRMMCLAPVTRCDWPCNECDLASAISSIRSLNVVFNRKDIALKGYRAFCRIDEGTSRPGPEVLTCAFANACAIDVACEQGCEHNVVKYSQLLSVQEQFDMAISAAWKMDSANGEQAVR